MNGTGIKFPGIALAGLLSLLTARPSDGQEPVPAERWAPAPSPEAVSFSRELIPPVDVAGDGHVSSVKNGVKFDVYFDKGPKTTAAIYAINTMMRGGGAAEPVKPNIIFILSDGEGWGDHSQSTPAPFVRMILDFIPPQ